MESNFIYRQTCPACDQKNRKLIYPSTLNNSKACTQDYVGTNTGYARYHDLYECESCRVLYMDPIDSALDDLCSEVVDQDYLASWEDRSQTFKDHLSMLKPYVSQGRLLDVGCYAGIFLEEAKQQGFQVSGIEPSKWAADYARSKVNCEVYQGMFDSFAFPNAAAYDLITIWDVIEHLANPKKSIRKAFQLLRPGGYIAITTHDIQSIFARLLGSRYPWLMRFHLVHFSPDTLSQMLISEGFEIEKTIYYKKSLSINYLLKRIGIVTPSNALTKKRLAFNTGDMFMLIAKKKIGQLPNSQ